MKTIFFALLLTISVALECRADLIKEIRYNGSLFTISPSMSEAWSDVPQNSSTVRATLFDNPARKCWEFRLWNHLTGSADLTSGLDVTTGTDIMADFYIYPNGHAQAPKSFYVYGTDARLPNYSLNSGTFRVNFRPVAPTITASYAGGFTAIAGIDFPYYGMGMIIDYTPPIIAGNVIWDDLARAEHPSSRQLLGAAIRVNGIEGQPAMLDFLLGNRYATWKKYDLNQVRGYLDGEIPATGFTSVLSDPTTTISTDVPNDSFKRLLVINHKFSARDIQAGVFLRLTNIVREADGVRLHWNAQTTNQYTIQYFSTLGGPTNILGANLSGGSVLDPQALTNPARFYRLRGQ